MALDKSLAQVPFAGGLDQRTDPKNVIPGKLLNLINGVFDKNGAIRKRRGNSSITRTIGNPKPGEPSLLSTITSLFSFQDELLAIDGDRLYSFSPTNNYWLRKDQIPEPLIKRDPIGIVRPGSAAAAGLNALDTVSVDATVVGSYQAFLWCDNQTVGQPVLGDLKLTIVDSTTGASRYDAFTIATSIDGGRIVAVGQYVAIVYTSGANLIGWIVDTQSSAITGPTILFTDYQNAGPGSGRNDRFDIAPKSSTDFYVAYEKTSGVNRMVIAVVNTSLIVTGSNTLSETTTQNASISLKATQGETLWYAYGLNGLAAVRCAGVNPSTLAQTVSPTTVMTNAPGGNIGGRKIGIERVSATVCVVVADADTTAGLSYVSHRQFNTSAATVGPQRNTFCYGLDSRPFAYNGRVYVSVISSHPQVLGAHTLILGTRILGDLSVDDTISATRPMRAVGRYACRISAGCFNANGIDTGPASLVASSIISSVTPISSGKFLHASCVLSSAGRFRVDRDVIDFTSNIFMTAQSGSYLLIGSGAPNNYDGSLASEISYHDVNALSMGNASPSTTGGSLGSGQYGYMIIPTYVDKLGHVSRGSPAIFTKITTTTATSKATLTIPTIGITERQDADNSFLPSINLSVYRTLLNGSTYFSLDNYTPNDVTVATVTFVDTAPDANIASSSLAYTDGTPGQAMPNVSPPSSPCVIFHNQRAWLIGDDRKLLWPSRILTSGESVNFSDKLPIFVDEGGDFTALGSMDGKLFAFKKNMIFMFTGDGPDDAGNNSDLSNPIKIASDVGCVEPRSVVLTPLGLLFQSAKGIYLIDRSLNVSYIGKDVEDLVIQYNIITSAILLQDEQQVRFTCSNGTNGIVLMYDYLQNAWGQFQYFDTVTSTASVIPQSSCVHQGIYKWITPGGAPYTETIASYLDGPGQWVTLEIDTAWIKMAGITGFQRVYRGLIVGDRYTSHDITVDYYSNYDESGPTSTATFKSAVTDLPSVYEWEIAPSVQKTEAVRLRIRDAMPSSAGAIVGTGRGLSLAGLSFEVGVKRGAFKLPQLQRG